MPDNSVGVNGDWHMRSNFEVRKKVSGAWALQFTLGSGSTPPPPPPAPPGDIVDGSGNVVPASYLAIAYDWDAYMAYKFGPSATLTGVQTLTERPDVGAINHGGANNMPFQFGPENNSDPNLYMSIHAIAIGKPLSGVSIADAVVWCQNFAIDRETAQQRPYRLWQDNTLLPPAFRSGGAYRSTWNGFSPIALNDAAYLPVCEYRGENAPDSPNTRLSVIGTMGDPTRSIPAKLLTAGTYTAKNPCMMDLPMGYRPTDIAMAGGGEALVVSCWDTNTTTGHVLLVAVGCAPEGVTYSAVGPTARYDWWHGWRDTCKPFFCDQGNIVFMKIVQDIALPSTCKAPTSIAMSTGIHPYTTMLKYGPNGIDNFQQLDSPMANNRSLMLPGGEDYERYAKGAVVKVVSQSEKIGVYIDLQPCYAYYNDMYLGSAAKNLETQGPLGWGPTQWPYTLADKPTAQAVIIKTETYTDNPTDVDMTPTFSWWSKDDQTRQYEPDGPFQPTPHYPRSRTLFRNGTLLIHSLGRYAAGVKPTPDRVPADIALVGTVTGLGNNCCSMSASKSLPGVSDDLNDSLVYVARGDRKIGYVSFTTPSNGATTSGTVGTLVLDSRLDALFCCVVDPYHTESNVVTVANWDGTLLNYRYGPIIYGGDTVWEPAPLMNPSATPPGEFCGALTLPFRPISVHCSNVP